MESRAIEAYEQELELMPAHVNIVGHIPMPASFDTIR